LWSSHLKNPNSKIPPLLETKGQFVKPVWGERGEGGVGPWLQINMAADLVTAERMLSLSDLL